MNNICVLLRELLQTNLGQKEEQEIQLLFILAPPTVVLKIIQLFQWEQGVE